MKGKQKGLQIRAQITDSCSEKQKKAYIFERICAQGTSSCTDSCCTNAYKCTDLYSTYTGHWCSTCKKESALCLFFTHLSIFVRE